jgi:uncharacterized membrane protein
VFAVIFVSQLTALLGTFVLFVMAGNEQLDRQALAWGTVAGAAGVVGLGAFYRALSIGRMTLVAPIAATSVTVPVILGIMTGEHPSTVQLTGIVLAIGGTTLAAGPEIGKGQGAQARQSVLLALLSAAGFGMVLVTIARGSVSSVMSTLLAQRIAYVALAGLLLAVTGGAGLLRSARNGQLSLVAMGLADMLANLIYAVAIRHGSLPIIAVLSSLYPVVTAVLSHLLDGERLRPVQYVGIVGGFSGATLLVVGG